MKTEFLFQILFCSFCLFSCSESTINWKVYNSDESNLLPRNDRIEDMRILDNKIYLSSTSGSSRNAAGFRAILYEAELENLNFKVIHRGQGIFTDLSVAIEEKIFFINTIFNENSFENTYCYLSGFDLSGGGYNIEKEILGDVMFLDFIDSNNGVMLVAEKYKSGKNYLVRTQDASKTWDTLRINQVVRKIRRKDHHIYLLENFYSDNQKRRINGAIEAVDFYTGEQKDIINDTEMNIVDFDISDENNLIILCEKDNNFYLSSIINGESKTLFSFNLNEEILLKQLYRYNNFICVVAVEKNAFSTSTHFYISRDNGNSFKKEALPIDNFAKPITFYKDKQVFIYSGMGRLAVGEF